MKTIYLAGAIQNCSDSQCIDWRNEVKNRLYNKYNILDPMDRDYRGIEVESVKEIISGDEKDIDNSDIILAMAELPSWGTAMEIRDAFNWKNKQVIVVCSKDRPSPWLIGNSHKIFKTLKEAIEYLC